MSNVYSFGIHNGLTPAQLFFLVMLDESAKEIGVEDLASLAAVISGLPLVPTRAKPGGATKGTSVASIVSRTPLPFEICQKILPTLTLASVRNLKIIFTHKIGAFVGRTIPVVGEVLLARDAWIISVNTVHNYNRLVRPEDKVF
ncbi:STM2901 family protein [Paraburkholderia lacunae]|uniref:Uncharacterized protein n=1 Tax=Paraburkholderia lacunae TaxID=2211104 RepID=A0A370NGY4_9BURK|nr:hypothetical protein [Paraburkholderia lacunae]RDK04821.1 hypothetical protein DLM46_00710 [Paraburkholderia lacunae]